MAVDTRKTVASIVVATATLLGAIAGYEGYSSKAYKDPGDGTLTIGYGHTGNDVFPGMKITKEFAYAMLVQDVNKHWDQMKRYIKVPLHQYEAEALTSFSYNVGVGNFSKSTLLKKLNRKDYAGACAQLPRWNKAGGKVLPGLVSRRKDEYLTCVGKSKTSGVSIIKKYQ